MSTAEDIVSFEDRPALGVEARIDPACVVRGTPSERTDILFRSPCGQFTAGIWEADDGAWRITTAESEFVTLLEGRVTVTDTASGSRSIGPGQSFLVPEGFVGVWENAGRVRKFFVAFQASPGTAPEPLRTAVDVS